MRALKFHARALAFLERADADTAARLIAKLEWLAAHPAAETVVTRITNPPPSLEGVARLRVGAFRVILWLEPAAVVVYAIGRRADVYEILKKK